MTDEKLYFLCKKYGEIAVRYRNKFAGLLPEVLKRRLYKKKGFSSIFEFAAKLAGMSEEQVRRVLNLEKRFEAMPVLREMLVKGEVSVSKLVKVASIATVENQEDIARQVRLLPHKALETLARDTKFLKEQNGFLEPRNTGFSVRANIHLLQNLENASTGGSSAVDNGLPALHLAPEVHQKLLELQQKGIDVNALLIEFLEKREFEIAQEKEALAARPSRSEAKQLVHLHRSSRSEAKQLVHLHRPSRSEAPPSRHIPVRVRKLLTKEHGTKCSIAHCKKQAEEIHHTQRFSLNQNHNPQFLAPLCREHHIIAHSIDMKFHNQRFQKRPP